MLTGYIRKIPSEQHISEIGGTTAERITLLETLLAFFIATFAKMREHQMMISIPCWLLFLPTILALLTLFIVLVLPRLFMRLFVWLLDLLVGPSV